MRVSPVFAATAIAGLLGLHAHAGEPAPAASASVTLARHHTTNALDSPLALADRYTVLRGAMETTLAHELGTTRIAGEFELRRFDTYDIEDDAAAGLSAVTTVRAGEKLELRGTLSANVIEEGDDLALGDAVLGMRTRRIVLAAGAQAGLRLSPDTVLVMEGEASREQPGMTRFQEGVLPPARLEPGRDRLRLAATLTRTKGAFSYGVFGTAGLRRTEPVGLLPQIRLFEQALKLQGGVTFGNGATVAGSAGVEALRLLDGPFRQARPAYELVAATPLPAGLSLRGALKGGYDLGSKDDPLAVWVRRLEAEAGWQPVAVLRFGVGLFVERRDNVGLETRERLRGLYGEAAWQARENVAVVFRVDATRRMLEGFGFERRALDLQVAVNAKL